VELIWSVVALTRYRAALAVSRGGYSGG